MKTETITFKDFMSGEWRENQKAQTFTKASILGAGITAGLQTTTAHATVADQMAEHAKESITEIIMKACQPIFDLLSGCSYPVAFFMISGGFILIMTGQTRRGMQLIKWACIGFIGLQFAPALMSIVIQIGQSIQASTSDLSGVVR
jgi:hypothetical protein